MDDQTRELQALRQEVARLTAALGEDGFRLRRLAEVGAVQAKLNHDLRNLLTSALMLADRLSSAEDAKISHAGKLIVAALEQSASLIAATSDFAAERPPVLHRRRLRLAETVAAAAETLAPHHPGFVVENAVPAALEVQADPTLLERALGHLMRTAAQAQARHMTVTAEGQPDAVHVVLRDDGQPFRDQRSADPLSVFSGAYRYGSSGLGLVIARELIEAHGGSLALRPESGTKSTVMALTLPLGGRG